MRILRECHKRASAGRLGRKSCRKDPGVKLLLCESRDEGTVTPHGAIEYYDSVLKTMGGASETRDLFRLLMVSETGMCPGFDIGDNGGSTRWTWSRKGA